MLHVSLCVCSRLLGSAEVLALHGRMHTQRQKLFDQFSSLER